MKNAVKIVLTNIAVAVVFLTALEVFAYKSLFTTQDGGFLNYKQYDKIKDEFVVDNHIYINYQKPKKGDPIYFEKDGRSFVGEKYKSPAILLLGDSYTYGLGLTKKETFGYQLSEFLKKPVYNWGWCTEGIEYSLLEMKDGRNINLIKTTATDKQKPLDYVIYTYGYNQPTRLVSPNRQYRYKYLRNYGLLTGQKTTPFDNLYSIFVLKNKLFILSLKSDTKNKILDVFLNEILMIKSDVQKNFPSAKFVLLIYSDSEDLVRKCNLNIDDIEIKILNSPRWKELEKSGVTVIRTDELIGRKATADEIIDNERTVTIHPNAKAWATIIPPLCDRLYK